MVFSSLEFLFVFLPIVLIGYVFVKPQFANAWLMASSLYFYYLGAKEYLKLLLFIILVAYIAGLLEEKIKIKVIRGVVMFMSIGTMLFLMAYYKYYDFVIVNINAIFHKNLTVTNMILPIGISFFVFQAISYVVDVYRGEENIKNPIDMILYISFFPQLIAGPIVRYHNIRAYLNYECRKLDIDEISEGIWRFSIGLCKKVLLANNLGIFADGVFNVDSIYNYSIVYTWLGAMAYTLQIYYDFSGYSDMAIGLGRVFGFRFQENFEYPYIASSVREFWRRWHISLSQFFRDYVYIPLGGNRCSKLRWIINMMIVWLLTGIWHGAAWTYIMWGVLYGIIIIVEARFCKNSVSKNIAMRVISHMYTMVIVTLLWVIFRASSIENACCFIKNMIGLGSKVIIDRGTIYQFSNNASLIIISIILALPIVSLINKKTNNNKLVMGIEGICLALGTVASVSFIYMGSYNPFLYFMF